MAKIDDSHYKQFASSMEQLLDRHGEIPSEDLLRHQRNQLQSLFKLESDFRETLITHRSGPTVYKEFVTLICEEKRGILAARPYFRERQSTFTRYISKALQKRNDKALYRFRINWTFIHFVMTSRRWSPKSKISQLAQEISRLRSDILEQNLPLAISQARGFWGATPASHLTFMDIIQIQSQGLLLAIDKFTPPKKRMNDRDSLAAFKKFRAVAIGIMMRDRVNEYSATMLHFYPRDRAKMYRANKYLRKYKGLPDWDEVASTVNSELDDPTCRTTGIEISALLAAGSSVSGDIPIAESGNEEPGPTTLEAYVPEEQMSTEDTVVRADAYHIMRQCIKLLTIKEQKLLKMKGM